MCEGSEGVQHHLWSSDFCPAYRGIRTLCSSKPIPRCTSVRAEGGRLLTEESKVKTRWAGFFEGLHQADPPVVELDVRGVTIPIADPPINCEPPSFVETQASSQLTGRGALLSLSGKGRVIAKTATANEG